MRQGDYICFSQSPHQAKLVKLADKICNLRDLVASPPAGWSRQRKIEYFEWAKQVVAGLRGSNRVLEDAFDEICRCGIEASS